jgi:hypothetical protein
MNAPSSNGPWEAIDLLMILVGAPTDLLGDAKFGLRDFEGGFFEVPDPDPKRHSKCKDKCWKVSAYLVAPQNV